MIGKDQINDRKAKCKIIDTISNKCFERCIDKRFAEALLKLLQSRKTPAFQSNNPEITF